MANRKKRRAAASGLDRTPGGSIPRTSTSLAISVEAIYDQACRHQASGQNGEAVGLFGRILAIDANHIASLLGLGEIAFRAGQPRSAQKFFARVLDIDPGSVQAHYSIGLTSTALGDHQAARIAFEDAIKSRPAFAEAYVGLGNIHHQEGRLDDAAVAFRAALRINPSYAGACTNLGNVLREQRRLTEALTFALMSVKLSPTSALAYRNLATVCLDLGMLDDALGFLDRALALAPDFVEAQDERLYCLNFHPQWSAKSISDEHRQWGRRWTRPQTEVVASYANDCDPERRLRIGFVSGDFHSHPIGYFLTGVLQALGRDRLEIFCYSNGGRSDQTTGILQQAADWWRVINGKSDSDVEAMIRADVIDILVDLSGHAAANRLSVFNRRPAPVQASWLGYVATTGLPAIDYVISDESSVPSGSEHLFSEQVVRLPFARFCYAPPSYAPSPALRAASARPFTFGSFNDLLKVGPDVVRLWSNILLTNPDTRLILKWLSLCEPDVRTRLSDSFASHGVARERLEFRGYSRHADMLAEYGDVDVALDPFPFCGGLTTYEALWMGVPVVTLPMTGQASRQTAAVLTTLGLPQLIAKSEEEYLAAATYLANHPDDLRKLTTSLRPRLVASPLCNGDMFVPKLERAFRVMWKTWCAGGLPASSDVPKG